MIMNAVASPELPPRTRQGAGRTLGVMVTNTLLCSYLLGWAVTSTGLALGVRNQVPQAAVVVAAGAAWPVLALGAAQFATVALAAEVTRCSGAKTIDDELEELLTEWAISDAVAHDRWPPIATGGDNAR